MGNDLLLFQFVQDVVIFIINILPVVDLAVVAYEAGVIFYEQGHFVFEHDG